MTEISSIYLKASTDHVLLQKIGEFIRHHRLQQNKTQQKLAEEAGINRSTLIELEQGKRGNILTFIQTLRALNQLQALDVFEVSTQISPLKLAELESKTRKRASKIGQPAEFPTSYW